MLLLVIRMNGTLPAAGPALSEGNSVPGPRQSIGRTGQALSARLVMDSVNKQQVVGQRPAQGLHLRVGAAEVGEEEGSRMCMLCSETLTSSWGAEGPSSLSRSRGERELGATVPSPGKRDDGGGSAGHPSGSAKGARRVDSEDVREPSVTGMRASFLVWDAVISGGRKTGGLALCIARDPVSPQRCLRFLTHVCLVVLPLAV